MTTDIEQQPEALAAGTTAPESQDDTATGEDQDNTSTEPEAPAGEQDGESPDDKSEATDDQNEDPDEAGNAGIEAAKWRIRAHEAERRLEEAKQRLNDFRMTDLKRLIMGRDFDQIKRVYFDKPAPKLLQREFEKIGDVSSWFDGEGNLNPEGEKNVRRMMGLYGIGTPGTIPGAGRTPEDITPVMNPRMAFRSVVMGKKGRNTLW